MQLFIVRHAEPDYSTDSLTSAGQLEAEALAKRMVNHIKPDVLYSSPMGRARATMRPTAEAMGLTGTILEWAGELDLWAEQGPWGVSNAQWDVSGHWVRTAPQLPTHQTWHQRPPFDEPKVLANFQRVAAASDAFLAGHGYERREGTYACITANRKKITVFCHGGLGLTWLAHLLEIPVSLMWSGFFLPPSSVTTILFDEREKEWATPRCIGLGDLSHLYATGLKRSNMGIKANVE